MYLVAARPWNEVECGAFLIFVCKNDILENLCYELKASVSQKSLSALCVTRNSEAQILEKKFYNLVVSTINQPPRGLLIGAQ